MRIKSLHIKGFRCITGELSITFEPLTVLVGENGTGKTTAGLALSKLLESVRSNLNNSLTSEDFPYGTEGPLSLSATLDFSNQELVDFIITPLLLPSSDHDKSQRVKDFLSQDTSEISLKLSPQSEFPVTRLRWGKLKIVANQMSQGEPVRNGATENWSNIRDRVAGGQTAQGEINRLRNARIELNITPSSELMTRLGQRIQGQYKLVPEFRARSAPGSSSASLEAWQGQELAGVLFTLKNHADALQRKRYGRIQEAFAQFSGCQFEAVQGPQIQFYEGGKQAPIVLQNISAGQHQMLAWVTNLIGRAGLVIWLEHPEIHLHPHAIRFLVKLLHEASEQNQVIVTTHDPYLVDPRAPGSLRRFWRTPELGTQVRHIDSPTLDARTQGQLWTALRDVANREVVFARATILAEDESIRDFLLGIAPKLGFDLDAKGVSIVSVGGEDGFAPYLTVLKGLGIPHVAIRDKVAWGDKTKYPPDCFFSFGCELEEYLDQQGLCDLRQKAIHKVGTSKRRVAGELATMLERGQVPSLFDKVLRTAVDLATGSPAPP